MRLRRKKKSRETGKAETLRQGLGLHSVAYLEELRACKSMCPQHDDGGDCGDGGGGGGDGRGGGGSEGGDGGDGDGGGGDGGDSDGGSGSGGGGLRMINKQSTRDVRRGIAHVN